MAWWNTLDLTCGMSCANAPQSGECPQTWYLMTGSMAHHHHITGSVSHWLNSLGKFWSLRKAITSSRTIMLIMIGWCEYHWISTNYRSLWTIHGISHPLAHYWLSVVYFHSRTLIYCCERRRLASHRAAPGILQWHHRCAAEKGRSFAGAFLLGRLKKGCNPTLYVMYVISYTYIHMNIYIYTHIYVIICYAMLFCVIFIFIFI